ncbi:hypothetical protein N9S69_04255 [Flavobacteriaceae bacterium]|nr:hypothetical protein [Flavobacteriaceae bacterium]MDB2418426.1 hypothetical protein [Flavobacteriaceae bacterium]
MIAGIVINRNKIFFDGFHIIKFFRPLVVILGYDSDFLTLFSGKKASIRLTIGIINNQPLKPAFLSLLNPIENKTKKVMILYKGNIIVSSNNILIITVKRKDTMALTIKKDQNSIIVDSLLKLKIFLNANR